MKRLTHYIIAALAVTGLLTGCKSEPKWHVDGRIEGAEGQTMYVEASENGQWYILDSVALGNSGNFSFTQDACGYPDIYRLRLDDKTLYFPIDSIETVTVVSKAAAFDHDYTLAGTEAAEQLMNVDRKVLGALTSKPGKDWKPDSALKRELSLILLENPAGIVSYYIINKKIGGVPLFNPNDRNDLKVIGAVANAFNNYRPADPRTKYLRNLFLTNKRVTLPADTIIAKETTIIDVNLYDRKGVKQSLEQIAGKNRVVVLSFTAYSSDYSPALNIELNKLYTKHHDNGLEIYQIGFDDNEYNWRETASNLPWVCVYNAPTDGPQVLNSYNIGALPAMFVIRDGEIRERLTDATRIEQSVAKYL